jgi:death-on-curing protein
MDIFEMAATYLNSIAINHPFMDGNKRTALASSLTFLFMNGYEIEESYDEELADKTLDFRILCRRDRKI